MSCLERLLIWGRGIAASFRNTNETATDFSRRVESEVERTRHNLVKVVSSCAFAIFKAIPGRTFYIWH
ncbi:unnamed protein product [Danaus chrysippus]|uniref:(African queen) hypothetical protein n=1 Tax=Danaus chrysippus TaxID=151541 RepID=A0A8J2QCN1_9NEOP|nr:unnamed protein product [Danaus chrysippus]